MFNSLQRIFNLFGDKPTLDGRLKPYTSEYRILSQSKCKLCGKLAEDHEFEVISQSGLYDRMKQIYDLEVCCLPKGVLMSSFSNGWPGLWTYFLEGDNLKKTRIWLTQLKNSK